VAVLLFLSTGKYLGEGQSFCMREYTVADCLSGVKSAHISYFLLGISLMYCNYDFISNVYKFPSHRFNVPLYRTLLVHNFKCP
jgi:hypothetical protein